MGQVSDSEEKVILIAENDEMNYHFYKEVFRKSNVKLIWAKNGQQAVDYCNTEDVIDLVIMDVQMPVMDGVEATKQIKEIKNIPIIVLTAFSMRSVKEDAIEAKCDDFVTKPIRSKELMEVISKYIQISEKELS